MQNLNESQQAAQLLLKRRGMRKSLTEWARLNGYEPASHHEYLIKRLEAAAEGRIKKLAVFLPPGSAKSTYCSVLFPPWVLSRFPQKKILACSHSADLATSFGRKARNLVEANFNELGFRLASHSKAADRWETDKGGEYYATGVGAGIAGFRADIGLIDDPIGKKEDADSKLVREKQWDWYLFDFRARQKPDAVQILIMTRWHEADLGGCILNPKKNPEASQWEVVRIPFHAEENDPIGRKPGEMLWGGWFKEEMFPQDERAASALYQCRPTPESGDFFKKEWLPTYDSYAELPDEMKIYFGSDHAVSLRQEADRTCIMPIGVDERDHIWVLPDLFWKRADTAEVVEEVLNMIERRKPIEWWAESGHISKSIGPFLRKRMQERRVFTTITEVVSSRDKPTRAQSIRGRMQMGMVHFPKFASWWPDARHELLSFPAGEHDDFVDALSEIGQGLDRMSRVWTTVPAEPGDRDVQPNLTLKNIKEMDRLAREAAEPRYGGR